MLPNSPESSRTSAQMVGTTCQTVSARSSPQKSAHETKKSERHCVTWTLKEDQLLQEHVKLHGTEKWGPIAAKLHPKTGRQCRRRWQMYLNSTNKKGGGWSIEEDQFLLEAHRKHGNRWTEIAKAMFGRTDNAVKNRFMSLRKKRAKELQVTSVLSKGYSSDGTKQYSNRKATKRKNELESRSSTVHHSGNEALPQAQGAVYLQKGVPANEWRGYKPGDFINIVREAARHRELESQTPTQPGLHAKDAASIASEVNMEQMNYVLENTPTIKGTEGLTSTPVRHESAMKNPFLIAHTQVQTQEEASLLTFYNELLRSQAEIDASCWFEEAAVETREHRTMPCISRSTSVFCVIEEELISDRNKEFALTKDGKQEYYHLRIADDISIEEASLSPIIPKQEHAFRWMDSASFSEGIQTPVHGPQALLAGNTSPRFSEGEKQFLLSTFDDYWSATEAASPPPPILD